MHMQGEPPTMNQAPVYADVALDVFDYLESRIESCVAAGIQRDKLIVDPGIGFGKRSAENLAILRNLALFHGLGCRMLLGASRKGFGAKTQALAPRDRLPDFPDGGCIGGGAGLSPAARARRGGDKAGAGDLAAHRRKPNGLSLSQWFRPIPNHLAWTFNSRPVRYQQALAGDPPPRFDIGSIRAGASRGQVSKADPSKNAIEAGR